VWKNGSTESCVSSKRSPAVSMMLTALVKVMPKVWMTPLGFPVVPAV
jgi:hypothetical protein